MLLCPGKTFRVRIAPTSSAGRGVEGTLAFLDRLTQMMHEIKIYVISV